jgi:DNA modification methylase
VAAMATGRHYLGYEILPEYFDIARARLDAANPATLRQRVDEFMEVDE